jgi:predicted DNA repair protein MutK
MRWILLASVFTTAWGIVADHPSLVALPLTTIAALTWKLLSKGDRALMVKLDGSSLFHAHPDAAALLGRGNALVMGFLKAALDTATADAKGAKALDVNLADQIGTDVLLQLRAELGLPAVNVAAKAAGGEAKLVAHFTKQASDFIAAKPVASSVLRSLSASIAPHPAPPSAP